MPQLTPYFWLSQATWTLAGLAAVTVFVAVYVLPPLVEVMVARVYVTKL
jgi:hypothetical protein